MKKIRLVAIIAALALAISVYVYLDGLKKPVAQAPHTPVMVARVAIQSGDVIKPDMVVATSLPSEAVLPGSARTADEVVGRISERNAEVGEQLLVSRFMKAGTTEGGLGYLVESGMRAFTLPVDGVTGLAGMLQPRNRVDLLVSIELKEPGQTASPAGADGAIQKETKQYSVVVMQNILVLAVGQAMDVESGKGKEAVVGANTVTLQVTPQQAQKLNLAASMTGSVRLVLRSPLDTGTGSFAPMDESVFFKTSRE